MLRKQGALHIMCFCVGLIIFACSLGILVSRLQAVAMLEEEESVVIKQDDLDNLINHQENDNSTLTSLPVNGTKNEAENLVNTVFAAKTRLTRKRLRKPTFRILSSTENPKYLTQFHANVSGSYVTEFTTFNDEKSIDSEWSLIDHDDNSVGFVTNSGYLLSLCEDCAGSSPSTFSHLITTHLTDTQSPRTKWNVKKLKGGLFTITPFKPTSPEKDMQVAYCKDCLQSLHLPTMVTTTSSKLNVNLTQWTLEAI